MSLKTIPGLGKSGMSRMYSRRSTRRVVLAGDLAQIPYEQQVLEMRCDGHEILEGLYCLLALLRVAGAQGRGEDLLEQRRRAVGAAARPAASSWRITRSGRNSSRWRRRIVRRRATSAGE